MSVRRLTFSLLALAAAALPASGQDAADGLWVTVQNPITDTQVTRIRTDVNAGRAANRNVKKVAFDFNPDGKDAATDSYGACYELASLIQELSRNGITPIAFVHGKVSRHTVLPVLACRDLVMSSGATVGPVAEKDKPVAQAERNFYEEIAGISRAGAVLKMIDPGVQLVQGLYKGSTIYVDQRRVPNNKGEGAYAEIRVVDPKPIPMSGGVESYGVENARKFIGCNLQKETRAEVAEHYQFTSAADKGDPLRGSAPKAVLIKLEGPIDMPLKERVVRQINMAKGRRENTFFFLIETASGGDPSAAIALAEAILDLGSDENHPAQTYAFVPGNAPDLAAFPALACQHLVMFEGGAGGEAVLGDFKSLLDNRKTNADFLRQGLAAVAEKAGHPKLVVDGMFDRKLVLVQARNDKTGDRRLMNEAERLASKDWLREKTVKEADQLLVLNASRAKDLRVARTVKNKDIDEVYALAGVEPKSVRAAEPGFLDDAAAFLRRPSVAIILVIVGIAGLVLEMKAPGLIIPGVIAALCFVLFFWAQTQLGGQLIYLAIMLFLLGIALLGVEIFLLPGFGVAGVSGILLILAGLVLAGLDKAPENSGDWADLVGRMLRYGLTMAGAGVLAFVLSRFLPNIPYANRLMLTPPEDRLEPEEDVLPGVGAAVLMLGQVGNTESMLRPSGLANFGGKYVDVVTEGDFIPAGTSVQVIEVEGTRIVVKRV